MAINYPGPYEVRIFYQVSTLAHQQNLSCQLQSDPDPGTLFSSIYVRNRVNTMNPLLSAAIDAYIALIDDMYSSASATFARAELWKYTEGTFQADFVSSYDISATGASGSSFVAAGESIITFRTANGGSMRLHYLENVITNAAIDPPPFANATLEAIRQFVVSDDNWIYARDNSYPFAAVAAFTGQNEKIYKLRYRQ